MGRLKQNKNIDSLIQSIETISKSQCSLSEQDFLILSMVTERLQLLRKKKGRTNEELLTETVKVIELLTKFFC